MDYPKIHDVGGVFEKRGREKYPYLDEGILERIKTASMWLGEARGRSFYFEKDYTEDDARKAIEDVDFMIREVKGFFQV